MAVLGPKETIILVAEDDPVVRNLVSTMLLKESYVVLTAKDGVEAMELCEAFKDPLHLLLTDAMMPRMNGLDLAAAVRRMRPEMKVIVMSGYTIDTIRTENSADAFLRKPFVPPALLRCVQKVLASDGPVDCEQ
jgi:two-component system, cell cycle sensor histidine kinase and response regulator CckA